jgi:hypothetical protein
MWNIVNISSTSSFKSFTTETFETNISSVGTTASSFRFAEPIYFTSPQRTFGTNKLTEYSYSLPIHRLDLIWVAGCSIPAIDSQPSITLIVTSQFYCVPRIFKPEGRIQEVNDVTDMEGRGWLIDGKTWNTLLHDSDRWCSLYSLTISDDFSS